MSFWSELKRRRVIRVGVAYIAVGLGVLGAAELILDPLGLGGARLLIVVLTLLGFPVAVVLAWAYDVTPEGIERTRAVGAGSTVPASGSTTVATPFDPNGEFRVKYAHRRANYTATGGSLLIEATR